ncbi:MAG: DUF1570 domain-containing protein [Planctomycetota bacterium]
MDDSDVLLSCLFTNPPTGVSRKKVESVYADWKVALDRGERLTFADMLVRKGVLPRGEPERILAIEKAAYAQTNVKPKDEESSSKKEKPKAEKKREPSTKKPVKAAVPPTPSAPKTPVAKKPKPKDYAKQIIPALLVGLLLAVLVWRIVPKPAVNPLDLAAERQGNKPRKVDWLDPPKEGARIPSSFNAGTDPTLDVVREIINEATTGDPGEAEKHLERAIKEAKTEEEKQQLEEVRWRLKVVKKEREHARRALDDARRLAKEGKKEEAAERLAGVEAPPDSPERRAIDEARKGGGEVGRALKHDGPSKKDKGDKADKADNEKDAAPDAPAAPDTPEVAAAKAERKKARQERQKNGQRPKVERKEQPLPAAPPPDREEGPVTAPPAPPPRDDDDGSTIEEGGLKVEKKKAGSKRKHGQRPRGESKDGTLVTSFIDEADEDPEDDDAADPADFKGPVAPIGLATPKEIEPVRAEALGKLTTEGLEYLEKVKSWLTEQRAYRDGAALREAERVKGATGDQPNASFLRRVEVPGGLVLKDAIVSKYDAQGFVLKDPSKKAEWGSTWTQNPDLGFEVRRLAVDPREPRDYLRLGRWCARFRFFTPAKNAFRRATGMDPSLASKIPDLEVLEKESKFWNGKLVRSGETIRVTWNFDSSAEVGDFEPKGSIWTAKGKLHLECRDSQAAFCMGQKSVIFKDGIALDLRFDANGSFLVFGFNMRSSDEENPGRVHSYQVRYDMQSGRALLADTTFPQPLAVGTAGTRITTARLEVVKDSLWVRVGNFHAKVPLVIPPSWEVLPFIGSLGGTVSVDQAVFSGRAHGEWLRKTLGGTDFKVALRLEDSIGAPPWAVSHPVPQISAEVSYIASDVTPEVLKAYDKAKKNLDKKTMGGVVAALGQLKYVTDEAPDFAPGQYLLAKCALHFQRRAFALECLNEAVSKAGGFAEALALRAKVLAELRRYDEANADVKKALEWRPDLAAVHFEAGVLALSEQRLVDARDEIELSFALDPRDQEAEFMACLVGHSVDGPPWEKPTKVETEHYVWSSNLKKERVQQIANLLESVRPLYEQALGIKAAKEKRKSAVLYFDSVDSFQSYNQIAIQSGLPEAAIGVFFPLTKELQVCDYLEDGGGMKTCAVAFHEGFHQWFDRLAETDTIPYWANEGLGDYFGGAKVDTGILRVGQIQKGRLMNLFQLGAIPIDDLMNDDGRNFMAHGFQRYAQSWSVVHYLMEGDQEKYKPLLVTYLEHLRAGRSPVNAYNRTFGRVDMDQLEAGWERHVKTLARRVIAGGG